jgi:hypothetical protein
LLWWPFWTKNGHQNTKILRFGRKFGFKVLLIFFKNKYIMFLEDDKKKLEASYQISLHLATQFQRRRLFRNRAINRNKKYWLL